MRALFKLEKSRFAISGANRRSKTSPQLMVVYSKPSLALWSWGCSNLPIRHTVIIFWPDTRTRRFVDCQSQQSPLQDREGAKAIDLRWWLWQFPKQLGQEVANLIGIAKSDFLWGIQATVGYNRSVGKKHQNHAQEIKTNTDHGKHKQTSSITRILADLVCWKKAGRTLLIQKL